MGGKAIAVEADVSRKRQVLERAGGRDRLEGRRSHV